MGTPTLRAVLWDFGGVLSESPFAALAAYESAAGLPDGLIRRINSANSDTNAWSRLERSEVTMDEFADLFEAEAAAVGHVLDARVMLASVRGGLRPRMVEAVRRCHESFLTGLLTNNFHRTEQVDPVVAGVFEHFDVVIESAREGVRKPDPRFYEMACEKLGIEPAEAVFLDDLGINLKPARAMGMRTIKVTDPDQALVELQEIVGLALV